MSKEKQNKGKLSDEEKCSIAWEIGLEHIFKECGIDENSKEKTFKTMGPLLGFNQEQSADLSKKCELILGWEITKDVCYDFRQSRQWVMCRAWELMETERISFGDAMSMAWDGFKEKCRKAGAAV